MQDALLHAIVEQWRPADAAWPPTGPQALAAIISYLQQAGTYVDEQAPYIECSYGCGELAQAAVRACCVHGGSAALETLPCAILVEHGRVCGVKMRDGHVIKCSALVASHQYVPHDARAAGANSAKHLASPTEVEGAQSSSLHEQRQNSQAQHSTCASAVTPQVDAKGCSIARAIVLLDRSVLPEAKNAQFVVPAAACGHRRTVVAWHCDASLQACPSEHALLYMACQSSGRPAEEELRPVLDALLAAGDVEHEAMAPAAKAPAAKAAASQDHDTPASHGVGASTSRQDSVLGCSDDSMQAACEQRQPDPAQADATPAHACVTCFYTCTCESSNGSCATVQGLHSCDVPVEECTMDKLAADAERIFGEICRGCEFMSSAPAPQGAEHESQQETGAEGDDLAAALQALGVG